MTLDPERVEQPLRSEVPAAHRLLFVGIALECGLGLMALLIAWPFGLPILQSLYPTSTLLLLGIAATLPPVLVYLMMLPLRWSPFERIRDLVRFFICVQLRGCSYFELILLCAAAGFGEELLFRGLIQGGITAFLTAWTPSFSFAPWIAIVVAAFLFALAHAVSKTYILLALVIGLYFGAVTLWSDSLFPAILAHGLYDFFVIVWIRNTKSTVDG